MDYVDLYTDVVAPIGNVPLPTVLRNVKTVVRDFCKETRAYTHSYTGLTVTNAQVTLTPPANTRVWGVNSVTIDGQKLKPDVFSFDEGSQVVTLPDTVKDNALFDAKVVLIPTRAASACDDRVMDSYYETLVAGVTAAVLLTRNAEWFDPMVAQPYTLSYAEGKAKAIERVRNDDRQGVRRCAYGGL